jgi:hypothetical protein
MKKLLACFVFMIGVQEASATRAICERLINDEQGFPTEETDGVKVKIKYDEEFLAVPTVGLGSIGAEGFPTVYKRILEEREDPFEEVYHYTYGRFWSVGPRKIPVINIFVLRKPHPTDCKNGHTRLQEIYNLHAITSSDFYKCGCP